MIRGTRTLVLPLLMLGLFSLSACVTMPQVKSNYDQLEARAGKINTILLLQPDITINELSAGDVKDKMPEWTKQGHDNVEIALRKAAKGATRKVKVVDPKSSFNKEIDEIKELNIAVISSAYEHTSLGPYNQYHINSFPQRIENFDYSLGSVKKLLNAYRADGLLIVRGEDNITSSGRKALGVVQAINPFSEGQEGGLTFLQATLTDINGDILWWQVNWNSGGFDLRDPAEAEKFVMETLSGFPPQGGK